ncbi:MAG: hypothetical protein PHD48_01930 [Alphaproteobacteria bacterium]|nr:hypothetical protein [Alphaproteobacteria bacterium]
MREAFQAAAGRTVWCLCPCCGYKNALSVTVKNGMELFHCHAGCAQADLIASMRGHTQLAPIDAPKPIPSKYVASIRAYAQKLWDGSQDGRMGLVPVYLASRELVGTVPESLRFLSSHLHKPTQTYWPVMLAAVTDFHGKQQAIHRTYLAKDGRSKAPVEPAKMTLGAVGGFACHLASAAPVMAVSEGLETGLSVQLSTGLPTWAALSAGGILNLILHLCLWLPRL